MITILVVAIDELGRTYQQAINFGLESERTAIKVYQVLLAAKEDHSDASITIGQQHAYFKEIKEVGFSRVE